MAKGRHSLTAGSVALIAGLLVPLLVRNPYYIELGVQIEFYMVLAIGLNMVVGYCGLLDLGYAAFFAIGAYTTGILMTHLHFSFWFCIPFCILGAALAGVIIGGPTLRLRSDYLAVVTLGFGEIVQLLATNLKITGGATGIFGIHPLRLGAHAFSMTDYYYMMIILVVLGVVGAYSLRYSRVGRAWHYIREDEDAAMAMGVNTALFKLYAYITGAMWGSMVGAVYAVSMTAIAPESFSYSQSVLILIAVILGGLGSIPGVLVGAVLVVVLPELLRGVALFRLLVFGLLMVVFMILRPQGMWPENIRGVFKPLVGKTAGKKPGNGSALSLGGGGE